MARAKTEKFDYQVVELAGFAKALAHPARVEILRYLAVHGELPCMAIVEHLPLSQPACSRHINELLRVGLLESRNSGAQIFFRIRDKALNNFCASMSKTLHPKPVKKRGPSKPVKSGHSTNPTTSGKPTKAAASRRSRRTPMPK